MLVGLLSLTQGLVWNAAARAEQPATAPAEITGDAQAAESNDWLAQADDLTAPAGDEMLLFQDIPVVVSSSRQKTQANVLSVPVTVITAEDIHYSGLTRIPEILQFASGVNVVRIDRNHYAVGIRGMHDVFSDRTLVLIDGRSAYSPVFGGAEWFRLPLMMEDIQRIEIVRGPAGAAWGANAYNGVINIITKDPSKTVGVLASTTWNDDCESYSHLRWGAKHGRLALRTSVGYLNAGDSEHGGAGDFLISEPTLGMLMGARGFRADDFNRSWIIDNQGVYELSPVTDVLFGVAHSNVKTGAFELLAVRPEDNMHFETTRMFAKVKREDSDGSGGYLQWFSNFERSNRADVGYFHSMEHDLEGQVDLVTSETNKLSFGGNVRLLELRDQDAGPQALYMHGATVQEQMVGAFLIDRWQATDRLTLEGQIRGDWYSGTHCDWAGRGTALYALDKNKQHILRFSGAKAFRTPFAVLRRMDTSRVPVAPGVFLININPNDDIRNEEIYSGEFGYDGKLAKGVEFKANTYYQRLQRLIDASGVMAAPGGVSLDNIGSAHTYGVECELKLKNDVGEVSAFYNYNVIELDGEVSTIRSYLTHKNSAGMTGRVFLPHGMTFNTNFRYQGPTDIGSASWSGSVKRSFRWDVALAKKLTEHGEVMCGVSDLLNDVTPASSSSSTIFPNETPGRTFFVRLQVSF